MANLINFRDEKFMQYFNYFNNPQRFILYCAVINRVLAYLYERDFANLESFFEKNSTKDLFLVNSKSEYIIKNFETNNCRFTNDDYLYVLNYLKDIIVFKENESQISQEISAKFQKTMSNNHNLIEKSNGGIFDE